MNAGAMSAEERRQPRARFTRALRRICERLDAQDTHEVTWTERMFPGEMLRGVMRAETLWVVGSYARGAPLCGDLDLVLKLVCVEGERAPLKKFVSKAVPAYLRFVGTREIQKETPRARASLKPCTY